MKILKRSKLVLFPTDLGKRITGIRGWENMTRNRSLMDGHNNIFNTSELVEIHQAKKTEQLNRWDFVLELLVLISEEEIMKLPETINLPGEKIVACNS